VKKAPVGEEPTIDRLAILLDRYESEFSGDFALSYPSLVKHVRWMLDEMRKFHLEIRMYGPYDEDGNLVAAADRRDRAFVDDVVAKKREKFHRWLGFVQGCMYMIGMRTIDRLRDETREAIE
jgi:hypothetical protein